MAVPRRARTAAHTASHVDGHVLVDHYDGAGDLGAPWLASIAFLSATTGYGVFETGPTGTCQVEVAKTTDGGATFGPLVEVTACHTLDLGYGPELAFDDHGDGFVYSPSSDVLYVTHDGGSTWSSSDQGGAILSVKVLGDSAWMLTSVCPPTYPHQGPALPAACRFAVRQSTDGGATWHPSAAQPPAAPFTKNVASEGSLVRVGQRGAYVVGAPDQGESPGGALTVPVWRTTDGGRSWSRFDLPCGQGATIGAVALSAAPTGTLFAACAGQPGVGFQSKSVLVSTDGGSNWQRRGCLERVDESCSAQGMTGGYLRQIVALSATTAVVALDRGGLLESTDGGATWSLVSPYLTVAGDVSLFNDANGVALGESQDGPAVWHTSDDGASWTSMTLVLR